MALQASFFLPAPNATSYQFAACECPLRRQGVAPKRSDPLPVLLDDFDAIQFSRASRCWLVDVKLIRARRIDPESAGCFDKILSVGNGTALAFPGQQDGFRGYRTPTRVTVVCLCWGVMLDEIGPPWASSRKTSYALLPRTASPIASPPPSPRKGRHPSWLVGIYDPTTLFATNLLAHSDSFVRVHSAEVQRLAPLLLYGWCSSSVLAPASAA